MIRTLSVPSSAVYRFVTGVLPTQAIDQLPGTLVFDFGRASNFNGGVRVVLRVHDDAASRVPFHIQVLATTPDGRNQQIVTVSGDPDDCLVRASARQDGRDNGEFRGQSNHGKTSSGIATME